MRWISDKFDIKSMFIGAFMIIGFSLIIFGLIDIFKMGLHLDFNSVAISDIRYSNIAVVIMFICGIYAIVGHMYYMSGKDDPNPNRTQLLYKIIMLFMILATSIINSTEFFNTKILSISSIYLIGVGCLIVAFYIILRKIFLVSR